MSTSTKSQDSHFDSYVKLLLELADLMRRGLGDEDEAELVRDQMDNHWYEMDSSQIQLVRGLSADLYSIGVDRKPEGKLDENERAKLQSLIDAGQWSGVLDLVREHEAKLPPEEVAGVRGVCWEALGQHDAATAFFDEAVRINPRVAKFDIPRLCLLIRSGRIDEAVALAQSLPSDAWSKYIFTPTTS